MKKIYIIITFLFSILYLCWSNNVYAASASISASKTNVTAGEGVTIYVNATGAAWNLQVSGSVNDSIVGYNEDGNNQSISKSYTLNTQSAGTYVVTLSGDITDENDDNIGINRSVTVTVSPAPQPEPQPQPQPQPSTNNNTNNANTNNNTNTNNKTNNSNNKNNNQNTTETKNESEEKQPEEKIEVKEELKITKFEIFGYDIKFDIKKEKYEIEIPNSVNKIYLTVEGENITSSINGSIDISGKDKIDVTIKNKDQQKKYTISLKRINCKNNTSTNKCTYKCPNNNTSGLLIITIVSLLTTVILTITLIRKNKKNSLN